MKILAVCTGNICRSPFAEGYLRRRSAELKLDVDVRSAGTYALEGNRATLEAVAVAVEFGVDLKPHRASMFGAEQLRGAQLILVMSRAHEEEVLEILARVSHRPPVYLLGQFHPEKPDPPDIEDPIGGSTDDYRRCYRRIADSMEGFLALVREGKIRS